MAVLWGTELGVRTYFLVLAGVIAGFLPIVASLVAKCDPRTAARMILWATPLAPFFALLFSSHFGGILRSLRLVIIICHAFPTSMHTGSELLETWIPDSGFQIDRRKLKTADGGSAVSDCLVPTCTGFSPSVRPTLKGFLSLAGRYGLLTISIPRTPAPGQVVNRVARCGKENPSLPRHIYHRRGLRSTSYRSLAQS